jgi:small subunit ribosomal protein S17
MSETKKREIILKGTVVSNTCEKTVTVEVTREVQHPLYKKRIRKKKKYLAHDEKNKCQVGDKVRLKFIRPMSKNKRWMVNEILESAAKEGKS